MDDLLQLHQVRGVPRDAAPSAASPNPAQHTSPAQAAPAVPTPTAACAHAAVSLNGSAHPSATR
jgi:hypothetical protein